MESLFESSKCLTKTQLKKYLQKQMTKEHQLSVERHLIDCPLCSDAIDGYTNHYNFESDTTFENLDSFLKEKEKKMAGKTVQLQPRRSVRFNRIAAAILMFLIPVSGFLYWDAQSTDRLLNEHFDISANLDGVVRGEFTKEQSAILANATESFKNENYETSARLYQNFLLEFPENTNAAFYLGVSNIELGNLDKAIDLLTTVRVNSATLYEDATWYLILANLKKGNKDAAKILAREVKSPRYIERLKDLTFQIDN